MVLTYQKRNLDNIAKLGDNTRAAALKWHNYLVANNIDLLIYETIRTVEQQRENVKKGASQTMKSYHLVGQALDFVPIVSGNSDWNGYGRANVKQAIAEAKRLGFEWGGDWKGFVDKPHLQFNYRGYGTDTFGKPIQPVPVAVHSKNPKVIQRVRALVKGDIRTAPSHSAWYVRDHLPGEEFDVYARQGDWHLVGGADGSEFWIDGNGGANLFWIDNPNANQPQQVSGAKNRYVVLPASADEWRIYPLNKAPIKANALPNPLKPSKFGGLEYEILHDRGNWVFEIQTSQFGRVQIYSAPETGARVVEK